MKNLIQHAFSLISIELFMLRHGLSLEI